jgi:hypothetical protein
MYYNDTQALGIQEGHWNERTCVRREGGFSLIVSNLPKALVQLAKGAIVSISKEGAKLLKSAKVYEAAAKGATTVKVEKNHALIVGDVIAKATISAIEEGESYDTLTVDALAAAVKVGDVIAESIDGVLAFNYATVPVKGTPDIAVTVQAYDIDEASLPYPINDEIKAALTSRHAFKI